MFDHLDYSISRLDIEYTGDANYFYQTLKSSALYLPLTISPSSVGY